jgi:hypothetical protein
MNCNCNYSVGNGVSWLALTNYCFTVFMYSDGFVRWFGSVWDVEWMGRGEEGGGEQELLLLLLLVLMLLLLLLLPLHALLVYMKKQIDLSVSATVYQSCVCMSRVTRLHAIECVENKY